MCYYLCSSDAHPEDRLQDTARRPGAIWTHPVTQHFTADLYLYSNTGSVLSKGVPDESHVVILKC